MEELVWHLALAHAFQDGKDIIATHVCNTLATHIHTYICSNQYN